MTLVEFLTARLDEDERWALGASAPLREVGAKRRIIALAEQAEEASNTAVGDDYMMAAMYMTDTIKLLALPYADHEDYRAEWRL